MKRDLSIAFFILLICFCQKAAAQPPFAPLGAKWVYDVLSCELEPVFQYSFTVTVSVDSVIQGKYCTLVPGNFCSQTASCESDGVFVHQDGSKVFVYEPLYDTFQMVYDFSLQAGSSYRYVRCDKLSGIIDSMTISVVSADEENQVLRMVADPPGNYEKTVTIWKGIGGEFENRLLFGDYCVFLEEPCFFNNLNCYYVPGSNDFLYSCGVNSANEKTADTERIVLYPNPVSSLLSLKFSAYQHEAINFQLFNTLGEQQFSEKLPIGQREFQVSILDLPNGLYFWQAASAHRHFGSGRLAVSK